MADAFGSSTVQTVQKIPLLTINAGPRDKEGWEGRLKQVHGDTCTASCTSWMWTSQEGRVCVLSP